MKVLVVFYSLYGHVYRMAQAVAEGVKEVAGAEAVLRRVCGFLGIDFLPALLRPADREHHFLHSSVSPYLKGSNTVRADERWGQELSPEQVERVARKLRKFTLYRDRYQLG